MQALSSTFSNLTFCLNLAAANKKLTVQLSCYIIIVYVVSLFSELAEKDEKRLEKAADRKDIKWKLNSAAKRKRYLYCA